MVVAGALNSIRALDMDGNLRWKYDSQGQTNTVVIAPDGEYIAANADYDLLLLHPSGNLLWSYKTGDMITDIAMTPDASYIVAGSRDGRVYYFNRAGSLLWSYYVGDWVNTVSITADGAGVLVGSNDKYVGYLDRDGTPVWMYRTDGWVKSTAISGDRKTAVAGTNMGSVYFFNLTSYKSAESTGGSVSITPSISGPSKPASNSSHSVINPSTTLVPQQSTGMQRVPLDAWILIIPAVAALGHLLSQRRRG